tara:strand:- start:36 stop:947 length:912 start_codon:yes stop_codon:yes gene_type:complete
MPLWAAGAVVLGGMMDSAPTETKSATSTLPFTGSTGLGTTGMAEGGAFTQSLDPRFLNLQNQAIGAGSNAFGQLGNFGNTPFQSSPFDVGQSTQDQYNLLESIQQPQRQDASLGLEDRLFQQGRLGSTGGGIDQRNQQNAFGQQQSQNLFNAYNQGLAGQQQQFGQQLGQSQQQLAQQQMLANMGQGMFGTALAPEQTLQQQMTTFGSIAPQETSGSTKKGGLMGAIGGIFSDERLKDNLKLEGKTESGVNLYSWTWNKLAKGLGIDAPEYGVIAQEVLKVIPNAVYVDKESGYYKVNYDEVL